jgi:CheY-like chemotaxis protein
MYLPLAEARVCDAGPAHEAASPIGRPALNVLLVEDDGQVANVVAAMLEELGHRVTRAEQADAALSRLRGGEAIDLLLTDLIMPGDKSGVDLARETVRLRPGLPIILSSGYTGEALSAAEGAPWPLLRKPYDPNQLAQAIAQVTG